MDQLDQLDVIHVTGTKGKGSTCAYSERILREHGLKTGFFSSPHLVEVRERIRIDGRPISKQLFSECFWNVHKLLDAEKKDIHDMPMYFCFLTIMAFRLFIEQKVDVAIVEVGIGGEHDCTNVLRKVAVVGITSLGIDHVPLLGPDLESIAWNKAGIMKPDCRAFTVPQPQEAMEVLRRRSIEKNCSLEVIQSLNFGTDCAEVMQLNASLAVAMCDAFLSYRKCPGKPSHLNNRLTQAALEDTHWPGRFQTKKCNNVTYYLDGAHTAESIAICSKWYQKATSGSSSRKILVFNVTGKRDAIRFLEQLDSNHFDLMLFVTNVAREDQSAQDNSYVESIDLLVKRCEEYKELWTKTKKSDQVRVFRTVSEAVIFLDNQGPVDVLVTGSLHLVGSVLSVIEPELNT